MTITRDALRGVHLGGWLADGWCWSGDTKDALLGLVVKQARDAIASAQPPPRRSRAGRGGIDAGVPGFHRGQRANQREPAVEQSVHPARPTRPPWRMRSLAEQHGVKHHPELIQDL